MEKGVHIGTDPCGSSPSGHRKGRAFCRGSHSHRASQSVVQIQSFLCATWSKLSDQKNPQKCDPALPPGWIGLKISGSYNTVCSSHCSKGAGPCHLKAPGRCGAQEVNSGVSQVREHLFHTLDKGGENVASQVGRAEGED